MYHNDKRDRKDDKWMSYYNDDENKNDQLNNSFSPLQERLRKEEEQENRKRNNKKTGSKAGYFMSGLAGIIVGALLMWLLLPSMVNQLPSGNQDGVNVDKADTKIDQTATEVTTDFTKAVEKVSDAVVGITNIQEASATNFWNQQPTTQEAGSGSGVIYKIEGDTAFIVTNHHVVEGAKKLEVTLNDGTKKDAKLVGSDVWTDLAVVAIDSENIKTVAQFGNSDVLKQGESVIAIGNPLGLEFYGSVTTGVISGKDRSVPVDLNADGYEDWQTEVLQTDAAINPGNSGGALVNIAGELIGINSMKIAESTVEGLGFSIPINSVIPIIEELEQKGEVVRPQMGISLLDVTDVPSYYQQETLRLPKEVTTGIVVSEVVQGSPADRAGIQKYDVIVEMDGKKVENSIDLRKYLYNEKEVGDTLSIKAYRQGKLVELKLKLTDKSAL